MIENSQENYVETGGLYETWPHVLVVDDDRRIRDLLCRYLSEQGFVVIAAADAFEAAELLKSFEVDALVVDVMMPGKTGLEFTQEYRVTHDTPVLLLTALGETEDRISGLEVGADDYLPKPFRMEELLARIRALIRRSVGLGAPIVEAGPISLDTRQMRVARNGVPIAVSPLEYRLLSYLMHHRGRVVTVSELLEHLYGDDDAREANALEAAVARLRKKVGPGIIETRRGFGYEIGGEKA